MGLFSWFSGLFVSSVEPAYTAAMQASVPPIVATPTTLISLDQFRRFAPKCPNPGAWAVELNKAASDYDISEPLEISHWLGQMGEESGGFTAFSEDLYYTNPQRIAEVFPSRFMPGARYPFTPAQINSGTAAAFPFTKNPQKLGNRVYSNMYGNGSEASGDGYKYRGQGPMQLTFKSAYQAAQDATGRPYVDQPQLLQQPPDGALVAAWFWSEYKNCKAAALADDIEAVTKKLAGSLGNLPARKKWVSDAKAIWCLK